MSHLPNSTSDLFDQYTLLNRITELRIALLAAKRQHTSCDDCWYSCPLSDEGCCDETKIGCTCGAQAHNDTIDAVLAQDRKG